VLGVQSFIIMSARNLARKSKRKRPPPEQPTSSRKERALVRENRRLTEESESLLARVKALEYKLEQEQENPIDVVDVSSGEDEDDEEGDHEGVNEDVQPAAASASHVAAPANSNVTPLGSDTNALPSKIGTAVLALDVEQLAESGALQNALLLEWDQCCTECIISGGTAILVTPSSAAANLNPFTLGIQTEYPVSALAVSKPFQGRYDFTLCDSRPCVTAGIDSRHCSQGSPYWSLGALLVSAHYQSTPNQFLTAFSPEQGIDFKVNTDSGLLRWRPYNSMGTNNEEIHEIHIQPGDRLMVSLNFKGYVTARPLYPLVELHNHPMNQVGSGFQFVDLQVSSNSSLW
jgi:hypothetical protein